MSSNTSSNQYKSEACLVKDFVQKAQKQGSVGLEFPNDECNVDIVLYKKEQDTLTSFEAKLTNWRSALMQAYRNTTLSDYSYVLMPYEHATKLLCRAQDFMNMNVGLCSILNEQIIYLIKPQHPNDLIIEKARLEAVKFTLSKRQSHAQ